MTFTSEPGTGGPTDPAERLWNGRGHVERLRHEFQSSERSTMAATFRKRSAGFVGQRFGGVEFSPAVEGSGAMMNFNAAVGRLSALAPLILRLAIGGVMAYHGIQKLTGGLAGVEEMFRMFQVPAPAASAVAVTAIEIIAGFALLLGIGTRLAAAALAVVLLGAIVFVKAEFGIISSQPMPGAELDIALLAGLAALILLGPGPLSADRAVGLETTPASS